MWDAAQRCADVCPRPHQGPRAKAPPKSPRGQESKSPTTKVEVLTRRSVLAQELLSSKCFASCPGMSSVKSTQPFVSAPALPFSLAGLRATMSSVWWPPLLHYCVSKSCSCASGFLRRSRGCASSGNRTAPHKRRSSWTQVPRCVSFINLFPKQRVRLGA